MSPSPDRPGHTVTRSISMPCVLSLPKGRPLDLRLVAQAWSEERSVTGVIRLAVRRYLIVAEPEPATGPAPMPGSAGDGSPHFTSLPCRRLGSSSRTVKRRCQRKSRCLQGCSHLSHG